MRKLVFALIFALSLAVPASALEITPPDVPPSGQDLMPEDTSSFPDAIAQLLRNAFRNLYPDLAEASRISITILCSALLISILYIFSSPSKIAMEISSVVVIASSLLQSTGSLIHLGADTVQTLSEYGKLLLPIMTTAMAAQGAPVTSAALYAGTAAFDTLLSSLIANLLVPLVYIFLILATGHSALHMDILKKMRDFAKWAIGWILKILLTIFTTYISITGVVSGTTDAVTLKATKITISSFVPVVGGILSDASEAILVSAGLMKNAAGIYGILAILAVFLSPFLKISIHYAVFKITAALTGLFAPKTICDLIEDFSSAMGFLLAMTSAACLLLLISTICFLKGAT